MRISKYKVSLRNLSETENEKFKKQKAQEKMIHSKINKENILEIKDMSFTLSCLTKVLQSKMTDKKND